MAKVEQVLSLEPQHELKFRGKPEAGHLPVEPGPAPRAPARAPEGPAGAAVTSAQARTPAPARTRRRARPRPPSSRARRPGAWCRGRAAPPSPQPLRTVAILTCRLVRGVRLWSVSLAHSLCPQGSLLLSARLTSPGLSQTSPARGACSEQPPHPDTCTVACLVAVLGSAGCLPPPKRTISRPCALCFYGRREAP